MRGPFTTMTDLPEFAELVTDWHDRLRADLLTDLRRTVNMDHDLMVAVRRLGYIGGQLDTLDSFISYIQKRLKSESSETHHALRKVQDRTRS